MYICNPLFKFPQRPKLKGIVFDCDGVMFDSKEANRAYYNKIREGVGLDPMSPEEEEYVHVHSVLDSIAHIVPKGKYEQALKVRKSLDYKDFIRYMQPETGLYPLLFWLRDKGLRLAVNTNRTNTMDLVLDIFGLRSFFVPVVVASMVSSPKPFPEGLNLILENWGIRPEETAYIGDSEVDQATAEAAGVAFWAYKNVYLRADLHIDDFYTLKCCLINSFGDSESG